MVAGERGVDNVTMKSEGNLGGAEGVGDFPPTTGRLNTARRLESMERSSQRLPIILMFSLIYVRLFPVLRSGLSLLTLASRKYP